MSRRTDRDVEALLRGDDSPEPPEDLLEALRAEIPEDLGARDKSRAHVASVEPLRPARPVDLAPTRRAWMAAAAVFVAVSASWLLYREVRPGAGYEGVAEHGAALSAPAVEEKRDTTRQAASAEGPTSEARAFGDVTPKEPPVLDVRDSDEVVRKAEVDRPGDLAQRLDSDVTASASTDASPEGAELGASLVSPANVAELEEEDDAFPDRPPSAAKAAGAGPERAEMLRPAPPSAATRADAMSGREEQSFEEQRQLVARSPRFRAERAAAGALWRPDSPWTEALSALRVDRESRPGEAQRRQMLEALDEHPALAAIGALLLEVWMDPALRSQRLPGLVLEIEALHAAGVQGAEPLLELARLLEAGDS
ncbi:MAG: hypothetical protein AAGF23_22365 [Acidobacteriota bacterium]